MPTSPLVPTVDGGALLKALQMGRKDRSDFEDRQLERMYLGEKIRKARSDSDREESFRHALRGFSPEGLLGSGELPRSFGQSSGRPLADAEPSASQQQGVRPVPSESSINGDRGQHSDRDAAFMRMWEVDPVKAMEIDSKMRDNALQRIKAMRGAYGFAIENLANVANDADYQSVKGRFERMLAPLGIDLSSIPKSYPGPEGVRGLLMRALDASKQLAALDRRDRLEWDVQDDVIDNERSDRNTESMIEDRDARRGLIARGQNMTDARVRHGQSVASNDRRRGQDITDKRLRETGGGKKSAGGDRAVVDVKTPEQARALKPGTVFRTPDGRLKVR